MYINCFKMKHESFLIECDTLEDLNLWNKEEHGKILRLIAVDGDISEKETEYLNKNFGFEYTADELTDIYESCEEEISHSFDEQFENGITYIRSINEKLADAYKELLELIL